MAIGKNFKSGIYEVKNKEKYLGKSDPTFRSSWELHCMRWFDNNPNVLEWYSELPIPYESQVKGRKSRYMVDFYVKFRTKSGEIREELIEVKPIAEVNYKPKPNRAKKWQIQEQLTYQNNLEKWNAADKYARERGWKFRIITENSIFKG